MPTAKPRITITLTEHQHAVLSHLSTLQKASMSSIVVDLIDTTLPVLERLAGVLDNAANAPRNVLNQLRKSAEIAESEVTAFGSPVVGLLEQLLEGASGGGSKGSAAPPRAAAEGRPPTSNRGVRNVPPALDKQSISPSKSRSSVKLNERAKK